MNDQDTQRFSANLKWFNEFFEGLSYVLNQISDALMKHGYAVEGPKFYYPKSTSTPGIPTYLVMGLAGSDEALQVVAVFDLDLMTNQPLLEKVLSLVFVKHPDRDKFFFLDNYCLRVVQNFDLSQRAVEEGFLAGEIRQRESAVPFYAFQIPLVEFSRGKPLPAVIEKHILNKLAVLPEFN